MTTLRREVRATAGRDPEPSAGSVDSQSVKATFVGGPERGDDGNKHIKGRKRHLLVDSVGPILAVVVTAANVGDRVGAHMLFGKVEGRFSRLRHRWADNG